MPRHSLGTLLLEHFLCRRSPCHQRLWFSGNRFADDLNAFKCYPNIATNDVILRGQKSCQAALRKWGRENQVAFDSSKESFSIMSRQNPYGNGFVILGLDFDTKLIMKSAVDACVFKCGWKLKKLLWTRRYFTNGDVVTLFKAHILSYIEYRTPGIYHASSSVLESLDNVLRRLLRELGLTELEALHHFNLAPLETRRDIAMLGVIHRAVLGKGPRQLQNLFVVNASPVRRLGLRSSGRIHSRTVHGPCECICLDYCLLSVLGLARVYNLLPEHIVVAQSVSSFQKRLQKLLRQCSFNVLQWHQLFSPRVPMATHLLRNVPSDMA